MLPDRCHCPVHFISEETEALRGSDVVSDQVVFQGLASGPGELHTSHLSCTLGPHHTLSSDLGLTLSSYPGHIPALILVTQSPGLGHGD